MSALPDQQQLNEGELLNAKGQLNQAGYATQLCKHYDRSAIRAGRLRIKEWDYYCISDGATVLALTIADNSYMGLDSATLIDLTTGWQHTKTFMRLMPLGKTGLPATSATGDVAIRGRGYQLRFDCVKGVRTLHTHIDDFIDGKPLDATVTLTDAPQDSMVIVTPFAGKPKHFYYNQKINCLRAQGHVSLGTDIRTFEPATASAVLDWGRGVWTYHNTWFWSSVSGHIQGVPFGFNLGYGFGDTRAATENMLFYHGQAHKLGQVSFSIPTTKDGRDDFMTPWTLQDTQGRLNLRFTPMLDRAALTDLKVLKSDQHQVFGRFSGTATLDDGTVLTLPDLVGFAEKVENCW